MTISQLTLNDLQWSLQVISEDALISLCTVSS